MLRKLPASQHLPHTFAADVTGFGSHVLICVAGQLVQPNTTGNQQQSMLDFHRAFLLLRIPSTHTLDEDQCCLSYLEIDLNYLFYCCFLSLVHKMTNRWISHWGVLFSRLLKTAFVL